MRGSVVKFEPGVRTELKNESVPTLMALSATPVALLNERTRPLRAIMNCVGPTAPIVSGGQPEQSLNVAAVKFTVGLTVCCPYGVTAAGAGERRGLLVEATALAGGSTCRGVTRRTLACGPRWRSRAMICPVVSCTPVAPVCGIPTTLASADACWASETRTPPPGAVPLRTV